MPLQLDRRPSPVTGTLRRHAARCWPCLSTVLLLVTACQQPHTVDPHEPNLDDFVKLLMPRRLEVQPVLTRPVSFRGDGHADGLELFLAAYDSFGDTTKVVGTFNFELRSVRPASADELGQRLAYWSIAIDTSELLAEYWDRWARYHHFPLRLDPQHSLPAGEYILTVETRLPVSETLFAKHRFSYDGSPAPGPVASTAGR